MEADFEPEDKYSWYFGPLTREETNEIIQSKQDSGAFLVRDSQSIRGDFVLCVKEGNKVSHYIINRVQSENSTQFRIGDKQFNDIPSLLKFYKTHYLDTTTLVRPVPREKFVGKFDFSGRDPEDLPFKKGDLLELISKDEEEWWTARNRHGRVGSIPVSYVAKALEANGICSGSFRHNERTYQSPDNSLWRSDTTLPHSVKEMKLPAFARVVADRNPNAYDKSQLRLKKGEIVKVHSTNVNGQWEGEVNGRRGIFPFTHVQFVGEDEVPVV